MTLETYTAHEHAPPGALTRVRQTRFALGPMPATRKLFDGRQHWFVIAAMQSGLVAMSLVDEGESGYQKKLRTAKRRGESGRAVHTRDSRFQSIDGSRPKHSQPKYAYHSTDITSSIEVRKDTVVRLMLVPTGLKARSLSWRRCT